MKTKLLPQPSNHCFVLFYFILFSFVLFYEARGRNITREPKIQILAPSVVGLMFLKDHGLSDTATLREGNTEFAKDK